MLGYLFSTKAIIMKEKAKVNKDDFECAEDDNIDNAGYRDIPTIGVSALPLFEKFNINVWVFCNDCDELVQVQFVIRERGLDPHDCDVHVGFYGGQGLLKIGFTVTERSEELSPLGRSKYSQVR